MRPIILILVDGMRPDALPLCGNKYAAEFIKNSLSFLDAQTVMPSLTLPCHMSLFHSVPPQRHGTVTNIYTPQPRPVKGLFEILNEAKIKCASFYNWEELRDLSRPGTLVYSEYQKLELDRDPDMRLTESALQYIKKEEPGFVFLYLGATDITGHTYGWMGKEYLAAVSRAWDCIQVVQKENPEAVIIVTADHGGHDFMHGADCPEDMTIPILISGAPSSKSQTSEVNILDIAPAVTRLFNLEPDPGWRGHNLFA